MPVKKFKPYTPSRRHMSVSDFSDITKTTPEKRLTGPNPEKAGRNNPGRITMRRRGGGRAADRGRRHDRRRGGC